MAYKIQYTPDNNYRYPPIASKPKVKWGRICTIAVLLAAALWISANGIPDFLIPGDPQITRAAATDMITNLKDGAPVEQAVSAFCRQILDGAQQ